MIVLYIPDIRRKCLSKMNLLKKLVYSHLGSDRQTLLKLYRSVIRLIIDYGSSIYSFSKKLSYLQIGNNFSLMPQNCNWSLLYFSNT